MTDNVFLDRAQPPSPAMVEGALGTRVAYLDELIRHVPEPRTVEWKHYGKTIGWTMKLLRGKRNLCFIAVYRGCFGVSFVFGDKAVRSVEQSDLPPGLVAELVNARRYVEGRGVTVVVRSRRALGQAKILLDVKQAT